MGGFDECRQLKEENEVLAILLRLLALPSRVLGIVKLYQHLQP
jgi:hypothetical protein